MSGRNSSRKAVDYKFEYLRGLVPSLNFDSVFIILGII